VEEDLGIRREQLVGQGVVMVQVVPLEYREENLEVQAAQLGYVLQETQTLLI
jgi:hypothetical protein